MPLRSKKERSSLSQTSFRVWNLSRNMPWLCRFFLGLPFFPLNGLFFYFRGLTHRLQRMEAWWWFIAMILAPITAMTILGPFIVCPHTGKSIFCIPKPPFMQYYRLMSLAVHCQPTPKFVRREHIWVYYTAASDVVTDVMRGQRQTISCRSFSNVFSQWSRYRSLYYANHPSIYVERLTSGLYYV